MELSRSHAVGPPFHRAGWRGCGVGPAWWGCVVGLRCRLAGGRWAVGFRASSVRVIELSRSSSVGPQSDGLRCRWSTGPFGCRPSSSRVQTMPVHRSIGPPGYRAIGSRGGRAAPQGHRAPQAVELSCSQAGGSPVHLAAMRPGHRLAMSPSSRVWEAVGLRGHRPSASERQGCQAIKLSRSCGAGPARHRTVMQSSCAAISCWPLGRLAIAPLGRRAEGRRAGGRRTVGLRCRQATGFAVRPRALPSARWLGCLAAMRWPSARWTDRPLGQEVRPGGLRGERAIGV